MSQELSIYTITRESANPSEPHIVDHDTLRVSALPLPSLMMFLLYPICLLGHACCLLLYAPYNNFCYVSAYKTVTAV